MWPNPQFPPDLVTFTEEILDGKLHFLYTDIPLSTFPLTLCCSFLSHLKQKWNFRKLNALAFVGRVLVNKEWPVFKLWFVAFPIQITMHNWLYKGKNEIVQSFYSRNRSWMLKLFQFYRTFLALSSMLLVFQSKNVESYLHRVSF